MSSTTVLTGHPAVLAALTDPGHTMPDPGPCPGPATVGWLRGTVARFCDGAAHRTRRALAVDLLDGVSPTALRARAAELAVSQSTEPARTIPATVLAEALGVPGADPATVGAVAASYQPHTAVTPAADRAVGALMATCGGVADERTAAVIGLLVQAYAATAGLLDEALRTSTWDLDALVHRAPPVRVTRRVRHAEPVELDLASAGLPFGAGAHACPGREHAMAIADGVVAALHPGKSRAR